MVRALVKVLFLLVLVVAGAFGIVYYRDHFNVDQRVEELQQQKLQLQKIIQRLSDERRVAKVLVTDQKKVNDVLMTTLLFQEYARDGSALGPKSFTIQGDIAHIDAMVIKFDHDLVEQNDPLRGHSIVLFYKLYSDYQTPQNGFPIDQPGREPDFYRGSDPAISQFERDLWANFWKLADDLDYRKSKGVRVADGEGPWTHFEPNRIYTITIETNGGLNITSEPMEGIYQDALKQRGGI